MGQPQGRWGPFYVFVQDLMTSPWCTCTNMSAIVAPLTPAMTKQERLLGALLPLTRYCQKHKAVRQLTRKLIAPSAFETSLVHWYGGYSREGEILASAQARVLLTFTSSRLT